MINSASSCPKTIASPETIAEDHEEIVRRLSTDLLAAFQGAVGDEMKLRDAVFLFARGARRAGIPRGWVAEAFGSAVARSALAAAERDAVFRFLPRCDEIAAAAQARQSMRPGWWHWRRLAVWLAFDVGQHCI